MRIELYGCPGDHIYTLFYKNLQYLHDLVKETQGLELSTQVHVV